MIRRPPRSTLSSSSAASDVYKRQAWTCTDTGLSVSECSQRSRRVAGVLVMVGRYPAGCGSSLRCDARSPVSYTHLRAHETPEHLVCRLLLEKKKNKNNP